MGGDKQNLLFKEDKFCEFQYVLQLYSLEKGRKRKVGERKDEFAVEMKPKEFLLGVREWL